MNTLKRILLDPNADKSNRIEKNQLKYFLGGRSGNGNGYLTCTCYWDELEETGLCGSNSKSQCETWASDKYPQTSEWFGSFSHCDCDC